MKIFYKMCLLGIIGIWVVGCAASRSLGERAKLGPEAISAENSANEIDPEVPAGSVEADTTENVEEQPSLEEAPLKMGDDITAAAFETCGSDFQVGKKEENPRRLTRAQKRKLKKIKNAYDKARTSLGRADDKRKIWQKFVKKYPGKDNPYLEEAKAKIAEYNGQVWSTGPTTRVVQKEKKGYLKKEVIRDTVHGHIGEVMYCYEKQLELSPELEGKVYVAFFVSKSGGVSNARVTESAVDNKEVEDCIVNAVNRWTFPKPLGDAGFEITYPFHLASPKD